jgi:hypothetical protein
MAHHTGNIHVGPGGLFSTRISIRLLPMSETLSAMTSMARKPATLGDARHRFVLRLHCGLNSWRNSFGGHAQLDTTARYTQVATNVIRRVMSPNRTKPLMAVNFIVPCSWRRCKGVCW